MDGCDCNSTDVPQKISLRIAGGILTVLSVLLLGFGGAVYSALNNVKLGAWWSGVLALITGVLGLWAGNRGVAISIAVLGSFSLIVAVIGSVVDGIAASVFGQLKACVNLGTEEIYGDASDVNIAAGALCANLYIYDYADTSCLCVDGGLSSGCYFYELANPSDTCDIILTSYVDNLSASTAFAALVAVLSLVISIIACVNSCSKTASRVQDDKVLRQVPVPIVVISQAQDTNQKSLATVSIATAA